MDRDHADAYALAVAKADQARALAAKGVKPADIARMLGITRQAVYSATRAQPRQPGKTHQIGVRLSAEQFRALSRARRKGESRSAALLRLAGL